MNDDLHDPERLEKLELVAVHVEVHNTLVPDRNDVVAVIGDDNIAADLIYRHTERRHPEE